MSSICPYNVANFGPLTADICWRVWGTPANFNRFHVLPSLLQRCRSPEANQTLHDVWPSPRLLNYIYISGGSGTMTEFCHMQNSFYVQVLRSLILPALLHGTPAAGVSQTLWRGTRNRITKLPQRAPPIFGRAAITLGSHHVGHRPTFYFSFLLHWLLPQPAAKTPAWILTDNMSKDRGPCKKCLLRTHTHP